MRALPVAIFLLAAALPGFATAQTATPTSPSPAAASPAAPMTRGGNITRDEYIERAKRNAAARFDRMDANHDGILTPEERRAARGQRAPRTPQ